MTRYKSKEAYENNLEYIKSYNKQAYKQVPLRLNKYTEPDLINWLFARANVQGYIKELIRKDMEATYGGLKK